MFDRHRNVLLALSLAANVFLVGGLIGGAAMWSVRRAEPAAEAPAAGAAGPRRPLRLAADGLAPEQRRAFRLALRDAARNAAPDRREAREQRAVLLDLLAGDGPDRAAVEAAMTRAREADMRARAGVERAVADFAVGLPAEQRTVFVQSLRRSGTFRQPPAARPATGNAAPVR